MAEHLSIVLRYAALITPVSNYFCETETLHLVHIKTKLTS